MWNVVWAKLKRVRYYPECGMAKEGIELYCSVGIYLIIECTKHKIEMRGHSPRMYKD